MAEFSIEELLPCSEDGCHPDGERHITECPAYYRELVVDDRNAALEAAAQVQEKYGPIERSDEVAERIRKLKGATNG